MDSILSNSILDLINEEWRNHYDIETTVRAFPNLTRREVIKHLEQLPSYSLNKNVKKGSTRTYTHRFNPFEYAQIDTFSRYVIVEPIKNKSSAVVFEAFKSILKHIREDLNRYVKINIFSDLGAEFNIIRQDKNKEYYNYDIYNIPNRKPVIVERFHRTLQEWFRRVSIDSSRWTDKLDTFINIYNNRIHNTLNVSPVEALKTPSSVDTTYKKEPEYTYKYRVGDLVRALEMRDTREKKKKTFSRNVYTVIAIDKNMYKLSNGNNYYEWELVNAGVKPAGREEESKQVSNQKKKINRLVNEKEELERQVLKRKFNKARLEKIKKLEEQIEEETRKLREM